MEDWCSRKGPSNSIWADVYDGFHSIDTDLMVAIFILAASLTYQYSGIINNCKLFLDIPRTRAVGIGTVYNTQDAMIHNAQILSNHLRVSIDISIEDDALPSIHVVEDNIIVRGALGTFVAWPEHLIDVVPIMGKVSADHSVTSPPRIDEHASKKSKVVKSKP
ncbi:hypothetical protein Lal_00042140 [Lupinus albus]|nr:hypothetical protein Lal_00042140 [Lupinus albus]